MRVWLALVLLGLASGCTDGGGENDVVPTTVAPDSGLPIGTGVVPQELRCEEALVSFHGHVPACSEETRDCVDACPAEDEGCVGECIEADDSRPATAPNGLILDCRLCVSWQTVYCVEQAGCQEDAAALSCCRSTHCSDAEDPGACSAVECASERDRYSRCLSDRALHCITASTAGDFAACFAE